MDSRLCVFIFASALNWNCLISYYLQLFYENQHLLIRNLIFIIVQNMEKIEPAT